MLIKSLISWFLAPFLFLFTSGWALLLRG